MRKKRLIIIAILSLAFFLIPNKTMAAISEFKETTKDGVQKISFKSDCTKYTTQTKFPENNTSISAGPQIEQNIYYSKNGSGTRNLIWFQHGDGGCSSAPRLKCESAYFKASEILSNSKNGKNFILFCPEMNPSGGDGCYKHWSIKYAEFFPCLYNDFLAASKQAGIDVSQNIIFASHSQGGPATSHVTLKQPSNIKVSGIIRFDSCYGDQCLNEASIPFEKRGQMLTYASTLGCKAGESFCNATSNQNATIGKEISKKQNVAVYKVNNADHGKVPTLCHLDFLNHDSCGSNATFMGGTTVDMITGGSVAAPSTVGSITVQMDTFADKFIDETKLILETPKPQIKLPGLNFTDIKAVDEGDAKYLYIPFLGEYLAAAYKYAVVVASIIAVIMIINAGFGIATSGGNSEKVNHSKTRIQQAIIGLLLAVGSYVLLYTINPNLVEFKNLKVLYIKGRSLDNTANESVLPADFVYPPGSYSGGALTLTGDVGKLSEIIKDGNNIVYGFNGVPYFSQYDNQWAKLPFGPPNMPSCTCGILPNYKRCQGAPASDPAGDDGNKFGSICCTDIAHGGCNITSYAMVLYYHKKLADPRIIAFMAVESGARTCNGGVTKKLDSLHKAIEAMWPDMVVEGVDDHQKVIELLKQKKPIITRDKQVGYTSDGAIKEYAGHFMVYTGVDENQKIIFVNDPGNRNPRKGITHISYEQFFAKKITFWYVHPK